MKYTIVKHAHPDVHWEYWSIDPQSGVGESDSAYYTYTGKACGIESSYENLADAEEDCKRMNEHNPSGYYAVCPVLSNVDLAQ